MGSIWTALGNRLETAWKRPTKPNSKRPTDAVPYDMAKQVCPVCGAPIAPVNGSVDLYCTNDACPAKTVNRVIHFASKPCMDIKGLGPQMIQDLVDEMTLKEVLAAV